MPAFALHPQIAADTLAVTDLSLCTVRLMDDARFPWAVLVPALAGLSELTDLNPDQQGQLMAEIDQVSRALKTLTGCDRINVAAFGNMVPQLHLHVIARFRDDPAWPGSAIGHGPRAPYAGENGPALAARLATALSS